MSKPHLKTIVTLFNKWGESEYPGWNKAGNENWKNNLLKAFSAGWLLAKKEMEID